MSYRGNKSLKQGLLILPLVALFSGCGLDVKSGNSQVDAQAQGESEPTVQVAGTAMKGVIQQGIVTAQRITANEAGHYSADQLAAKPVRTAEDGSYELRLQGKAEGWALVELRADQATRMVCDVVPSCAQTGAEPVAFGNTLSLDSDFVLRGAGDLTAETVYLTPLTHLAVTLAEHSIEGGLSPAALADAFEDVEGWFGLSAGSLRLAPPDLTRLDELDNVSADGLQVAIANAAFLALVNDHPQWQSIADVLNDMTAQVTANGVIDILGDGENLALTDIVGAASLQASELQLMTSSSIVSQRLAIVASRNVHRFKTIADVYEESDNSLADGGNHVTPGEENHAPSDAVADNSDDQSTDGSETPVAGHSGGHAGDTGNDVADGGNDQPAEGNAQDGFPTNAAMLTWTAPLTRVNGESLSMGEIAGFEVVYGTSADTLDQALAIGDASIDELLVDQLESGTWYFAVRTLDTDGNRSQLSEVVNKQI
ncbi:MAG: hypothetical protein WD623_15455 [Marinobacter sp.]|uniref:hypothetical protein n=1 Tax=Marinobacter sp. TaxID=50741 RepID=UPI0034A00C12